jgi:hypothetical protein
MAHKRENFIGAWRLIDWRIEYHDGQVTRPFGQGAHGFIIYAADGTMTASIAKPSRPVFGLANARNATSEQKAQRLTAIFTTLVNGGLKTVKLYMPSPCHLIPI